MNAPTAFISYSHDSPDHKAWVLKLASDLRNKGVDATVDQWDLGLGGDLATYMTNGISSSNRVLLVCSESFVNKAEAGVGGVGYERLIVTYELVQNIDTRKFIPLLRNNASAKKTPAFLGPRLYVDFTNDTEYEIKLTELLREIHDAPEAFKPPLGPNPFSGAIQVPAAPVRNVNTTGLTPTGVPVIDDAWFSNNAVHALEMADKQGFQAHMELRFALHDQVNKSQIELLSAVQASEIKTFGWPIGITMQSREEFRPHPFEDGIRAEIAIPERTSYDYWALRTSGDFYLLQSLFEDQRDVQKIFFNTRIVRIAEALLFAANLYANLGVPPETRISARVTHRGLAGRTLTSSSMNRQLLPEFARENQSQTQIVVTLGGIRKTLVQDVKRIAAPLFMLFNFTNFGDDVYADIVRRFERGEVS